MTRRWPRTVILLAASGLITAACSTGAGEPTTTAALTTAAASTTTGAPTTSAAPTTTTTAAPTTTGVPVSQMCLVAGAGGIADGGVSEAAWAGLGLARDRLGVEILFREAPEEADVPPALDAFAAAGCDLIITVGTVMEAATAAAACELPEQPFAIVGASPVAGAGSAWAEAGGTLRCDYANVRGITFATEEAAFLAGYLAAGMSETRKVGTFGSSDAASVIVLMDAFAAGARYFADSTGQGVQVIGWNPADPDAALLTGSDDPEQAGLLVESLAGLGTDVILSAAGDYGQSGAAAAAERGILIIGGAGDDFLSAPEFAEVWLTSLAENVDTAVLDTVTGLVERGRWSGPFVGTLANGGVGLAPYRPLEREVPTDLADALDQLAADVVAAGGLAAFLAPPAEG